ncbi:ATPase, T2SS/T4P/T4SS family, partial [Hydrogenibacillus schlegelii]|uniref:ATPase, T2SS/T4P/T4SS family n=1 Tax=Hydrogenibacillus schlegelii TaxID=1484 RepID=UPI0034A04CF8
MDGPFAAWLEAAREALAKTPELLPTLRAAGVVDAGGSGLVVIFAGRAEALAGGREGGAFVPAGASDPAGASGQADDRPPAGRPAAPGVARAGAARARDLHLEPTADGFRQRMRVLGRLVSLADFGRREGETLLQRLKLLARLNIAERRLPQ